MERAANTVEIREFRTFRSSGGRAETARSPVGCGAAIEAITRDP
jgi:hypothetical protein